MRAPIGLKIRNLRKLQGHSQSDFARAIKISPSYLNLIEANKRDVGGAILVRIAERLNIPVEQLSGEYEQKLIQELEETLADPVLHRAGMTIGDARTLVAQFPAAARALAQLHRAYLDTGSSLEMYADRLRSDPLFSELLHQVLSHITAVRSGSEILEQFSDLSVEEQQRFLGTIGRESRAMSDVAETLIAHFDQSSVAHRSVSPARELDDFILDNGNHFPELEAVASDLRKPLETGGRIGEAALANWLDEHHGTRVVRGGEAPGGTPSVRVQYQFDSTARTMWFQGSTTAATRQFQLARLLAELTSADVLQAQIDDPRLTSTASRRLGFRAMGAYLAGAVVFPYSQFLADAERARYDIDYLGQTYVASFEQVAHRLVTLRRRGEEGIPFGFLRSDPAGRLTKQFPLPGLLLPNTGHACPLWAIYAAFRSTGQTVRQVVRFSGGNRYIFIAKTVSKRLSNFRDQPFHSSVMLAADILHAHRTVYAEGLDLEMVETDIPVGPACRLCTRRECAHRQEEAVDLAEDAPHVHAPLIPRRFDLGGTP